MLWFQKCNVLSIFILYDFEATRDIHSEQGRGEHEMATIARIVMTNLSNSRQASTPVLRTDSIEFEGAFPRCRTSIA